MAEGSSPDDLLDGLVRLVDAVTQGSAPMEDLDTVMVDLRRSVERARETSLQRSWETSQSMPEGIGENIAGLRRRAGWTQEQLASAMASMGFSWGRQTVADTERGMKRRASYEELFALAALFAVPAGSFLVPGPGRGVDLNHQWQVDGEVACELLLGRHGRLGEGGPGWRVAARQCTGVAKRPASALARRAREEN
jgi:transcriptional regulator with XRE-family HTH domain